MIIECSCEICDSKFKRSAPKSKRFFCSIACKSEWQRRQRPVTVDWLRQKYEVEKMDCTQIASLVGRDPKSVWNWLKGSGIKTRKRGFSATKLFAKGEPSRFKGMSHTQANKDRFRALRMADGIVPYLKNGKHWLKEPGKKPAAWRGGVSPERAKFYATKEWKSCVQSIWKRDNATCQLCGLDSRSVSRTDTRFDIHHIDGFSIANRRADVGNLILLCQPCHKWAHSRKNKEKVLLGKGH